MKKHEIPICEFCGKPKKTICGKNHTSCSIILNRLKKCLPENIPWVRAEIKDQYGIDVSEQTIIELRGV